jgi:hypothetical protein
MIILCSSLIPIMIRTIGFAFGFTAAGSQADGTTV